MTSRSFHIVLLLMSCVGTALPEQRQGRDIPATTCSQATPDDDVDDRADVQAAIISRCCLGPGVHDIDTPAAPAGGRRPYQMLSVISGTELCGAGPTTVLRFRGAAGGQDWRGIQFAGGAIHDVMLDTSGLTGTVEQTHAVHIRGPATGTIERVTFYHPERLGLDGRVLPGGDCVDVVGYAPSELVVGLVVRDNQFIACDRGGVQVHSGTVNLTVTGNEFRRTGDIDFNSEGAGGSSHWLIARNTFRASPANQGAFAIALDLVEQVSVVDNTLERGLYMYGCASCSITKNAITMRGGSAMAMAAVEAIKASNELLIGENTIRRPADQDFGPVIHIGPHGTAQSMSVRIVHNELIQETATDLVYAEGVADLTLLDNHLVYLAAPSQVAAGLRLVGSSTAPTSNVALIGNTFSGPMRAAIMTGGAGGRQGIGPLFAAWNASQAPGLACVNTQGIQGPVLMMYNAWPASSCGSPPIQTTLP